MRLLKDLLPELRPALPDAAIGASTYAARAFSPTLPLKVGARMVLAAAVLRSPTPVPGEPEDRVCCATEDELAQDVGCTSRSVRTALRALEGAGLVTTSLVERGQTLPNGAVSLHRRVVIRIRALPAPAVRGLRGAMARAFDSKVLLRTGARAVLAVILLHEGENGWCFPGPERIASMTGQSERTVRVHMTQLTRGDYLKVQRPRPRFGEKLPPRLIHANPHTGKIASGNRKTSPRKETSQEDTLAQQLSIPFSGPSTPRNAAVEAVLEAHADICGAPPGQNAVEVVEERLSEGLSVVDLETAMRGVMTLAWRRERLVRRSISGVMASKGQVVAFARMVDETRANLMTLRRPIVRVTPEMEAQRRRCEEAVARFKAMPRPTFA